ncbi:MAG: Gfo/Idh/MocA family oxidoreductase [Bacteroidetes bacterium]|nr:Gfo/Idh/MocA family oxidoreductase [Bacteroidota bacterium]
MLKSSSKNIKWAILGLGKIASKMAQDLQLSHRSQLWAVASRSSDKAQNFAQQFGAAKYYSSYSELCTDPDVDIVYIATPHAFHYEHSLLALRNGKAVLCEKPIGMNRKEVEALIAEAKSQNCFLMEGLWTRFIPGFQAAANLIEEGSIGRIQIIEANFSFKATYDPSSRLFDPKLGGGALRDIGIYPLYLSLHLLGIAPKMNLEAKLDANGIDRACRLILDYSSNQLADLNCSFLETRPVEATIYGSEGKLHLKHRFHHCEQFVLHQNGLAKEYQLPMRGFGYYHEIEEVENCLMAGLLQSDKHSWNDSLRLSNEIDRALQIMDQIAKP